MLGEFESLSLYELHNKLHEVQTAIKEKHSEEWDSVYKRKCPNHYVSFEEFLDTLYLFNDNKFSIKKDEFLYSQSEIWIPNILRDLRNCGYDWNTNEYTEKSKFTVPPNKSSPPKSKSIIPFAILIHLKYFLLYGKTLLLIILIGLLNILIPKS